MTHSHEDMQGMDEASADIVGVHEQLDATPALKEIEVEEDIVATEGMGEMRSSTDPIIERFMMADTWGVPLDWGNPHPGRPGPNEPFDP